MTEPAIHHNRSRRQSVLVTGGARRIGRAVALGFAARGWDVAVHHHESKREAQEVVDQIATRGGRAISLCADLSNEEQVRQLVPACVKVNRPGFPGDYFA
ncbi:SDR family NAD(P)-dependent oxidoreductase [Paraburkholderia sp. CNPSo 3076]|nr:SDR family NAD(P)-dependent oxidoreductase [Paraburkholderia sp. CNPSo 3076]MCX5545835.1 SDR family NAD(P)-dependent oxidoreductase [Paraburkholderia sp. CNPSo 3076]